METPNAFVQFVDDWLCYNSILGEGAYGEVRLLVHATTDEKLACKIIDHSKYKDAATAINREVTIHSLLRHENIVRYFGRRQEPLREFIFLEYASGGELFQMIEPDVGMASRTAQTFMKHLLNGLEYLHKKGVAHRDIKPENLLIDGNGILKITDFGLATIFRVKGKERLLDKKCGTKPYLAPEVLKRPYHAEPADLWSCGIVFVAMLTGELPWSDTTDTNPEYTKWKKDVYVSETPWSKLGNTALSLARQLLIDEPAKRLTLSQFMKHSWMRFNFDNDTSSEDSTDGTGERPAKRWRSMVESETKNNRESPQVTLSQPVTVLRPPCIDQLITTSKQTVGNTTCFSQPVRNDDVILYLTQSPITRDNFDKLVKRMTRFYVMCSFGHAVAKLCSILDSMHYSWTSDIAGSVLVSTVDCMKNQLSFRISVIKMDERILIDFRLAKGCGLEFKKKFVKIKMCVQNVINNSDKTTQQDNETSVDSPSETETSSGQEKLESEN